MIQKIPGLYEKKLRVTQDLVLRTVKRRSVWREMQLLEKEGWCRGQADKDEEIPGIFQFEYFVLLRGHAQISRLSGSFLCRRRVRIQAPPKFLSHCGSDLCPL